MRDFTRIIERINAKATRLLGEQVSIAPAGGGSAVSVRAVIERVSRDLIGGQSIEPIATMQLAMHLMPSIEENDVVTGAAGDVWRIDSYDHSEGMWMIELRAGTLRLSPAFSSAYSSAYNI